MENVLKKVSFNRKVESEKQVSVEQYNKELDEAMKQIKNGEVYSDEEVVKISKSW